RDLGELARQVALRDLLFRCPDRLAAAGQRRDQGHEPRGPAAFEARAFHATLPPGTPRPAARPTPRRPRPPVSVGYRGPRPVIVIATPVPGGRPARPCRIGLDTH